MMRSVLLLVCCWGLPSLASSFLPPLPSTAVGVGGARRAVAMPTQRANAGVVGGASWVLGSRGGAVAEEELYYFEKGQPKKSGNLWTHYMHQLETRPLWTKAWSSALLCALGDVLSQALAWKTKGLGGPFVLERSRLLIFSLMGGAYVGPAVHYWFNMLDSIVKRPDVIKRLPHPFARVLLQLSIDQTVGASVVNSGFLLTLWLTTAVYEGKAWPLTGLFVLLKDKWLVAIWPMLLANWKLWPLANLINFSLVPLKLRVLFANVVSIAWNMYMSQSANA